MLTKKKIRATYLLVAIIFIHHFNLPALRPIDREFFAAVYKNDVPKMITLVDQGANINAANHYAYGETSLIFSLLWNRTDTAIFLLNNGANPNIRDYENNFNPLMISSGLQNLEIASLLVTKTTNINAQDRHGDTALHKALQYHNFDIAILLLNNGADPNIMNARNQNALQLAQNPDLAENPECIDIINLICLYNPLRTEARQDESLFILALKEAISQFYQDNTLLLRKIVQTHNASIQAKLEKFINPKLLITLYQQFDQPKYLALDEEKQRENLEEIEAENYQYFMKIDELHRRENLEKIEAEDYKRIMENKQF